MKDKQYDIFISYCRKDIEAVKAFKQEVEAATLATCWMDLDGIESGNPKFTKMIIRAINACPIFLFMLTEASQQSENALKELDFAYKKHREEGKKVVIVYVQPCQMNDEFSFDYAKADTIDWQNSLQREKLIRDLKEWTGYEEKGASPQKPFGDEHAKKAENTTDEKKTACFWSGEKKIRTRKIKGQRSFCHIIPSTFSPDGKRIILVDNYGTIEIWDIEECECIKTIGGKLAYLRSAYFNLNEKSIISTSCNGNIHIWNTETGEIIKKFKPSNNFFVNLFTNCEFRFAVFNPCGDKIFSVSNDDSARIWDIKTGKCTLELEGGISDYLLLVPFSPDGKKIVAPFDLDSIGIWNTGTGRMVKRLEGHEECVNSAVFSPDGKRIVSASDDKTVRLWDSKTGDCLKIFEGHEDYVNSAFFSWDGRYIVTASYDKTVKVWDAQTGECIRTLEGHEDYVNSAVFSPNGKCIVSAAEFDNYSVRIWDVSDL